MTTVRFISFRNTTLKCFRRGSLSPRCDLTHRVAAGGGAKSRQVTFAFLNEHPPQIRVIRFAIVQFNLSASMKPPVSELLVVLYPKGCCNSTQIVAKRPSLSQLRAYRKEHRPFIGPW